MDMVRMRDDIERVKRINESLRSKGMIEKRGEIDGSAVIMYVYTHMEDVYPGTQSCGE